ncbi:hypothetical protein [Nocardia amamiensis]|nr:hypothetical protein [Nocardia amamiensis]
MQGSHVGADGGGALIGYTDRTPIRPSMLLPGNPERPPESTTADQTMP